MTFILTIITVVVILGVLDDCKCKSNDDKQDHSCR